MVFAAEIVLLLIGLYALISGRFFLTRSRVVHGYPGRVLGLLACAPLVMALALMFLFLRNPANESMQWNITVIEVGSIVACTGLIYFIGWPIAGPPWMQVAKEIG